MDLASKKRRGEVRLDLGPAEGAEPSNSFCYAKFTHFLQFLHFGIFRPIQPSPARGWPYSIAPRIPPGLEKRLVL